MSNDEFHSKLLQIKKRDQNTPDHQTAQFEKTWENISFLIHAPSWVAQILQRIKNDFDPQLDIFL